MTEETTSEPKKPFFKKAWFWIVVVILLIAIARSGEKGSEQKVSTTAAKPTQESEQIKEEKKVEDNSQDQEKLAEKQRKVSYKINDIVKFDDSEWVVLEAKKLGKRIKSNNMFQEDATTEGYFIRVKYSVKNLQNKEDTILEGPKLVDSEGREYREFDEQAFYIPKNTKTIMGETLTSGLSKKFYSVFEVPEDAKDFKFQARSLDILSKKAYIELGF